VSASHCHSTRFQQGLAFLVNLLPLPRADGQLRASERAGSRRIRGGLGSEQEEAMAAGGLGNEQLVAWLGMAASGSVSERADVDGGRRRQARRAAGRSH
jgi:hypothetical protein